MRLGACYFLLVPALFSQQPPDPCSVEGQAISLADGAPVRKADVTLHDIGPVGRAYTAVTDPGGNFAFTDLVAGRYRLSANRAGYVGTQTVLSLDPGQRLKGLALRLAPHAVVTGRIVDEKDEPVVFADVPAMSYGYYMGKKVLKPAGSGHTNDLGEYRIYGLAPGKYYVRASVEDDTDNDELDRSAVPEHEFYVTTYYPGVTDPAVAVPFEVGPGAQLRGINLTLAGARTFRIRGRVSGAEDVSVTLSSRDKSIWISANRDTTPAANGNFEIRRVFPGAYTLIAQAVYGGKNYFARQDVDVTENDVEKIVLTLAPGSELMARFVVEGEMQPNLEGAGLFLHTPQRPRRYACPIHDGACTMSNLGPDTYTVGVTNLPNGYWVKSIRMDNQEVKDTGIDLPHGPAGPMTITLAPNAGQIDGVVLTDVPRRAPRWSWFPSRSCSIAPTRTRPRPPTRTDGSHCQALSQQSTSCLRGK
ncbi:MAG TPA: carboxypeptidase-like regulatory domain-containing protein [Bryobacteraceae bacterium]|nr:carboxypeptidase-like regulatory domain-containing protein [Bryobacteraceae bacterium]